MGRGSNDSGTKKTYIYTCNISSSHTTLSRELRAKPHVLYTNYTWDYSTDVCNGIYDVREWKRDQMAVLLH